MSFILDALRKSEARRHRNEGPDLSRAPSGGEGSRYPGFGPGRWLGIAMLVVAVLVVVACGWIGRDLISGQVAQWTGSAPSDAVISADRPLLADRVVPPPLIDQALVGVSEPPSVGRTEREARAPAERSRPERQADSDEAPMDRALPRERIISDPDEIEAELARRLAQEGEVAEAAPEAEARSPGVPQRRRQVPIDPARVAEIERQVAEAEAQRREYERTSEQVRAREAAEAERLAARVRERAAPTERTPATATVPETVQEPGEPWRPSGTAAEYVRAWELPLSIRRNMPELRLTIHVYSADEAQRFVLVNGERFVVGDQLGQGARLVDIRREGAVVDFRDYRFLLEP